MQAAAQDEASSSSRSTSPSLDDEVLLPAGRGKIANNQALLGGGATVLKSTMCNRHHDMGKDKKLFITPASWWCLDFTSNPGEHQIGISVYPNETFLYQPKEEPKEVQEHAIYICEVGLSKIHAESIQKSIRIYVSSNGERILLATLSKEHPNAFLELVLSPESEFELSHTQRGKLSI